MEQLLNTQTLDFLKILISVLLGLFSSLIIYYIGEKRKEKNEKKKQMFEVYKGFTCTLKSSLIMVFNLEKEKILFNYHRRLMSIYSTDDEKRSIHKGQSEYHQRLQTEYHLGLIKDLRLLNEFKLDYYHVCGPDEAFEKMMENKNPQEIKPVERFLEYSNITIINEKKAEAINDLNKVLQESLGKDIESISNYLKTTLKIQ